MQPTVGCRFAKNTFKLNIFLSAQRVTRNKPARHHLDSPALAQLNPRSNDLSYLSQGFQRRCVIELKHIFGHFSSSINLNDFKNTRRFGSWLCFRHQEEPYNLVSWVRGLRLALSNGPNLLGCSSTWWQKQSEPPKRRVFYFLIYLINIRKNIHQFKCVIRFVLKINIHQPLCIALWWSAKNAQPVIRVDLHTEVEIVVLFSKTRYNSTQCQFTFEKHETGVCHHKIQRWGNRKN
jgi:hypothetical protein